MLRGTRDYRSFLALIPNCAGVAALCFLLLASTIVVVIPRADMHSTMLSSAYGQEVPEEEREEVPEEEVPEEETSGEQQAVSPQEARANVAALARLAGINTLQEFQQLITADNSEEIAETAGMSSSEELEATPGITDSQAIDAIAAVENRGQLEELIRMSITELLRQIF